MTMILIRGAEATTPEPLNLHNVDHFTYYISIVFSGPLIHHACQKHFHPPPPESSLIAAARVPLKETRGRTFASHLSEWLKGY